MGLTHRQQEIDHRIASELLLETRMASDAEPVLDEEVLDLTGLGGSSFVLVEFTKKKNKPAIKVNLCKRGRLPKSP